MTQINKLITHSGIFHADEVFATALIKQFYCDLQIIRTRNPKVLSAALEEPTTIIVDVGQVYDQELLAFDHHQKNAPLPRTNNVPYSSFGLVWDWIKYQHSGINDQVWEIIDSTLVQAVDAVDCGYGIRGKNTYSISQAISSFNDSRSTESESFTAAVNFASEILYNVIKGAIKKNQLESVLTKAIENPSFNGQVLIFNQFVPGWQNRVIAETDALYIVFQDVSGEWRIQGVPDKPGSFTVKKPLPNPWIDGHHLKDFVFCHKERFIAGAKSRQSIMLMLDEALQSDVAMS